MQQPTNLFYDWATINLFAPYLSLKDLLATATLSKEFNFLLKKYLRSQYSLTNAANANQFSQLKALLNRKVYVYDKVLGLATPNPSNLVLTEIQCQDHYSVVKTLDGRYSLTETDKLISNQVISLIPTPLKFKIVKTTEGNGLYCSDGYHIFRYTVQEDPFANPDTLLIKGQIQDIICNQRYSLVVLKELPDQLTLRIFDNSKRLSDFRDADLPFPLYDLNLGTQLVLGKFSSYFLHNEKVYEINLSTGQTREFSQFSGKKIVKLAGGRFHYIAFERTQQLTANWTTKDVVEFAHREGLEDYIKIFKSEKVTGKILLNMDKSYMEEVLGIQSIKTQQKLALRLSECNKQNPDSYVLYGWGSAVEGQLGSISTKPITKPLKIKIPADCEFLCCSGVSTFLYNRKTNETLVNNIDVEGKKVDWKPISNKKIWNIATYKDSVIFTATVAKEKISQRQTENIVVEKKDKLRTAKMIIDKLNWDPNVVKEEFRVGYFDKFQGLLQMSFSELEQSQIKQYRIEYFKHGTEVVWDKKKRIDLL